MAEAHWSGCDRGPGKQNDCCPVGLWIFVFVRGVAGCGIFLDLAEQQQGLYGTSGVVGPSGAITVGDCYDHRSLPRHRHHTITIPSPLPPPSASSYHHHHHDSRRLIIIIIIRIVIQPIVLFALDQPLTLRRTVFFTAFFTGWRRLLRKPEKVRLSLLGALSHTKHHPRQTQTHMTTV